MNENEVQTALSQVMDPELGRNIVELGMVRELAIDGGRVRFTLALTTMACPLKDRLVNQAREALLSAGATSVEVRLAAMTADERQRLAQSLQGRQAPSEEPSAAHLNAIDKVIAVMSGKGGVGKSSVTSMLAVTLAKRGARVGILDGDITGPSIPRMFEVVVQPAGGPLGLVPARTRSGIQLMSINLLLPNEGDAVIWRGPLIAGAIRQFWNDVYWGDLDYLIVDLPPGTSDAQLTVVQSIPLSGIVLVTSPQGLAGMVVRKSAQLAEKLSVPIAGLIENMSYVECDCGSRLEVFGPSKSQETADLLGIPLLGRLPLDPSLAIRADSGLIEEQPTELFEPILDEVLARLPDVKCKPIFGHSHEH